MACDNMLAQHFPHVPQPLPPPVQIEAPFSIQPGEIIQLTIRGIGAAQFRGFFVQARNQVDSMPIGRFSPSADVNIVNCFGMSQSAATHTNREQKSEVVIEWEAPEITDAAILFEF